MWSVLLSGLWTRGCSWLWMWKEKEQTTIFFIRIGFPRKLSSSHFVNTNLADFDMEIMACDTFLAGFDKVCAHLLCIFSEYVRRDKKIWLTNIWLQCKLCLSKWLGPIRFFVQNSLCINMGQDRFSNRIMSSGRSDIAFNFFKYVSHVSVFTFHWEKSKSVKIIRLLPMPVFLNTSEVSQNVIQICIICRADMTHCWSAYMHRFFLVVIYRENE